MKIRIKFEKFGIMRFIGHLDIMRYFQKAIRRADIDIAYSEGYSPHQIMSFALPLGVGLTSSGEYLDIEVHTSASSKKSIQRLNDVSVDGIKVVSYKLLSDKTKNAMSTVAAAGYRLTFHANKEPENLPEKFQKFMAQDQILITKKTKKSEREIDLKPLIYEWSVTNDSVTLLLSAGSIDNIKPELVMEAFYRYVGLEMPEFAFHIHRTDLFTDIGEEGAHSFVSLGEIGEEIGS